MKGLNYIYIYIYIRTDRLRDRLIEERTKRAVVFEAAIYLAKKNKNNDPKKVFVTIDLKE